MYLIFCFLILGFLKVFSRLMGQVNLAGDTLSTHLMKESPVLRNYLGRC